MKPAHSLGLLLLATIAFACGGTSEGYSDAARVAAASSLLTLEDLPASWISASTGAARSINATDLKLEGDCAVFNRPNASSFEGSVATAESSEFLGPDDQQAASSATVFDSPASAALAVDSAVALLDGCSDDIEKAARRHIEGATERGAIDRLFTDISVDFGRTDFKTFGDSTDAYRLQASVSALVTLYEVTVDVIVLRRGPIVGVLTYFIEGQVETNEEESLVRPLSSKLSESATSLTES